MQQIPRIGVAVIVVRDGKVLLGKRKNAHGEGCWGFPGGHLEFMETIDDCAVREVYEETGLTVSQVQFSAMTEDFFPEEQKHYLTLFMTAVSKENEPRVCEPEKCEVWEWFSWDALPTPLFLPIENYLAVGYRPCDV